MGFAGRRTPRLWPRVWAARSRRIYIWMDARSFALPPRLSPAAPPRCLRVQAARLRTWTGLCITRQQAHRGLRREKARLGSAEVRRQHRPHGQTPRRGSVPLLLDELVLAGELARGAVCSWRALAAALPGLAASPSWRSRISPATLNGSGGHKRERIERIA